MAKLDISKLKFLDSVERGGKIEVKIGGKFYPITKEQFLKSIEAGNLLDKLHVAFTKESIGLAQQEPKGKKNNTTNEG